MITSNFRAEVEAHGPGYYTAEILCPPTAVIFRVQRWSPGTMRCYAVAGRSSELITVKTEDLRNVKYATNALKLLTI